MSEDYCKCICHYKPKVDTPKERKTYKTVKCDNCRSKGIVWRDE